MKFQSYRASCGCAALHNALAALGIERGEEELIRLAGQTTQGTSARGLLRAIGAIRQENPALVGAAVKWANEGNAEVGLWFHLAREGHPLLLCVDKFEHWVACCGLLGNRFGVADSADNRMMLYYTAQELAERWVGPTGGYHAIIV